MKVVSIFGNTGDGKSHTLNHTFFGGKEVFKTSAHQASCTVGVWASYDLMNKSVVIDTEGLLGVTSNQNQRTRLLLKLLAISDVVIYRTRAERLHNDMFYFLSDASKAYSKHFTEELKAVSKRNKMSLDVTNLSPAVVIFHETQNTSPLGIPGKTSAVYISSCSAKGPYALFWYFTQWSGNLKKIQKFGQKLLIQGVHSISDEKLHDFENNLTV